MPAGPVGSVTRGTTNPNRLRRLDRWVNSSTVTRRALRRAADPLVVDLGYGAQPWTTVEWAARLRAVRPDVQVLGLEIEPERVARAQRAAVPGVAFELGGFDLASPSLRGRRPVLVRAANVLRQYPEQEVPAAWAHLTSRLAPGGVVLDATCDEIGRLAAWVTLDPTGPLSLTLAWRLAGLAAPGVVAERLPKVLIHRNRPGERVHAFLAALDRAWAAAAPQSSFGVRQRFLACCRSLMADGWPLLDGPSRWRQGELTVAWAAVAPGPGRVCEVSSGG